MSRDPGRASLSVGVGLVVLLASSCAALASSPETSPPTPPEIPSVSSLAAIDRPGDGGQAVLVTWEDPEVMPAGAEIVIERSEPPAHEWGEIATVKPGAGRFIDATALDGTVYRYAARIRIRERADSLGLAGATGPMVVTDPVTPHDNWFRPERMNSLIAAILFTMFVLGSIFVAQRGQELFIRRIAGLNAVDEAIGRATELGRKVLYVPGIQSVSDIQTIASLAILGHVARATARYGSSLEVPNRDPLTYVSARETVHGAYLTEGRPDAFNEEMVRYVTYDQFAYTAAVSGMMVRERPAANFLIGHFFAESLILAETGQSTGAIQIAGTADPSQLPFFVAACDYTLIGEELYAAGAYLSREPILLGSIRGQDIGKAILLLFGFVGTVAYTFLNLPWFQAALRTQ